MTGPLEFAADYPGRYITASRDPLFADGVTLDRSEVEAALRNIAEGKYAVLDCGPIVLDESDLVVMRGLLDRRAEKVRDLRLDPGNR